MIDGDLAGVGRPEGRSGGWIPEPATRLRDDEEREEESPPFIRHPGEGAPATGSGTHGATGSYDVPRAVNERCVKEMTVPADRPISINIAVSYTHLTLPTSDLV